jgi:hypothetical protein
MFAARSAALLRTAVTRTALRQPFNAALMATANRAFSSSSISSGATKLGRALEKELKYENDNYTQLEDIGTYLEDSGFSFKEEDNGVNMVLSKTVGDMVVEVCFDSRQPVPEDEPLDDEQAPEDEEDNFKTENYCDFTVFIRTSGEKGGLVVDATSMDTEINYNNVFMCEDMEAEKAKNRFERQLKGYPGPDFSTLDERIQTGVTEYLEGFGVNEHMSAFVECMSLDKDQRLYMAWLANLKDFVNKQ